MTVRRRVSVSSHQLVRRLSALSAPALLLLSPSAHAQIGHSTRMTRTDAAAAPAATGAHYAGITTPILSSVSAGNLLVPEALAFDTDGNLLVADQTTGSVYQLNAVNGVVSPQPSVSLLASGFLQPSSITIAYFVNSDGDAEPFPFTADPGAGKVSVLYSGYPFKVLFFNSPVPVNPVAVAGQQSVLMIADGTQNAVYPCTITGGFNDCVLKTPIYVANPTSLAVNPVTQGVYATERSGNIDLVGSTAATTVASGAVVPNALAIDPRGNFYVADLGNRWVEQVLTKAVQQGSSAASPILQLGTGLGLVTSVAADSAGNLFVGEGGGIYEIGVQPPDFGSVAVGTATPGVLTLPFRIDTAGTIGKPQIVTRGGSVQDFTNLGTGTCDTHGSTYTYAAGDTCTVVVQFKPALPGRRLAAVQIPNSTGTATLTTLPVSGTGTAPLLTSPQTPLVTTIATGFSQPGALAIDGFGSLFIADPGKQTIYKLASTNGALLAGTAATIVSTAVATPNSLAFDSRGNLYVPDDASGGIYSLSAVNGVVSSSSAKTTYSNDGASFLSKLAFNSKGDLVVGDTYYNSVIGDRQTGISTGVQQGGLPMPLGPPSNRIGVTALAYGPDDTLYAAQRDSILLVPGGVLPSTSDYAVLTGRTSVTQLVTDAAGDLFFVDNGALYEEVATNGTVSTSSAVLTIPTGLGAISGLVADNMGHLFASVASNGSVYEIDLTTPRVSFPLAAVGASSAAQSVVLQNAGNTALSFPVPPTGTNPSFSDANFSLTSTYTCPVASQSSTVAGTLAAGATCTYGLAYTPKVSGPLSRFLAITDNNLNTASTQNIVLTGTTQNGLVIAVPNVVAPNGIDYVTVHFTVGYGGQLAPTGTPTVTIGSGQPAAASCTVKVGHTTCSASLYTYLYGSATITVTQPADANYAQTTATATLATH